jgi:hypothetical protein
MINDYMSECGCSIDKRGGRRDREGEEIEREKR